MTDFRLALKHHEENQRQTEALMKHQKRMVLIERLAAPFTRNVYTLATKGRLSSRFVGMTMAFSLSWFCFNIRNFPFKENSIPRIEKFQNELFYEIRPTGTLKCFQIFSFYVLEKCLKASTWSMKNSIPVPELCSTERSRVRIQYTLGNNGSMLHNLHYIFIH